jgi:SAM-dependent methyltransferase
MSGEERFYNAKFYRELEQTRESARIILPIVVSLLKPASIVDVGCGAGHWLAAASELGISDVMGVEGDWIGAAEVAIPREKIVIHDLGTPLDLGRRFDLAIALEVAEHLPESKAREFIQTLCNAADSVLFSAAVPGQGGRRHLNEQWPKYWADLFGELGFRCHDLVRPQVWINPRVLWYYAQNCLLFVREGTVSGLEAATEPLPLVHPAAWSAEVARWNSPGKLIERLPKAIFNRKKSR